MFSNNPAGRLLVLADRVRKVSNNTTLQKGWATVFQVVKENSHDFFLCLSAASDLPRQAELAVMSIEDAPHDLLTSWRESVDRAFSFRNFDAEWKAVVGCFNEATILGLKFCNDTISRKSPEKALPGESISKLETMIAELGIAIEKDPNLSESTKSLLYHHIYRMKEAIRYHWLFGTPGIEKELNATIGEFARNPNLRNSNKGSCALSMMAGVYFFISSLLDNASSVAQISQLISDDPLPQPEWVILAPSTNQGSNDSTSNLTAPPSTSQSITIKT